MAISRTFFALLLIAPVLLGAAPKPEGLGRTFQKLKKTGKLTVGYLGGSITAGSGASKPAETSYRALTTKWFREQFPKAEIDEVNAAIGGTGSDLGAFRCNRDLLSKNPDLVFVEFAVNDGGNEQRVLRSMEGIVRQIWKTNPAAGIVFLYTIQKTSMAPVYDRGEEPKTVIWHERVARHYGIPSINVGRTLWTQAHEGKAAWESLLPDNVHPSDKGYAIYSEQINAFLAAHRNDKPRRERKKLPKPLTEVPFENARLVEPSSIKAEGWKRDDPGAKRFAQSIAADAPGTELIFPFKGTAVGLFWLVAPDSGDIEWSVDGGAPKRASSWDRYALRFARTHYTIFNDSLPPGEHVLKVRVLPEKNPESKGTWIRIGALLVN